MKSLEMNWAAIAEPLDAQRIGVKLDGMETNV